MLVHWIWLAQLPKVQLQQKYDLLERYGDAEDLYYASREMRFAPEGLTEQQLQALCETELTEAQGILEVCRNDGIRLLVLTDTAYPARLRATQQPPLVLYCKGRLPEFDKQPVIAAVGTRKASIYGMATAKSFGAQIAACGALVVSGCAGGIDAMAMEGALETGAAVVGVLGCGVDVVYPKSNRKLLERVLEQGCLLSEYPPKTPPYRWNFPARNRILSGISNGVLVVEAPASSGALITAELAVEQGRDVYVVPGNVGVASCAGSNALLREQGIAVFSGWDVVRDYATQWPNAVRDASAQFPAIATVPPMAEKPALVAQKTEVPGKQKLTKAENDKKDIDNGKNKHYSVLDTATANIALTQDEQTVLACLTAEPQLTDAIIGKAGLPSGKVLSALTTLALKGLAANHPGRRVSLKKG